MRTISNIIVYLYFRFRGIRVFLCSVLLFILFGVCSVIFFHSGEVRTTPAGWGKQKVLSPAGGGFSGVHSAGRGNLAAAVFEGSRNGITALYAAVSFDGGVTFTGPVRITSFPSKIKNNPRIAISHEGHLYVLWHHLAGTGSEGRIFFSRSEDYGASWTAPENITFGMEMEILPSAVFDARNRLHLFFTAHRGKSFNLYHTFKTEDGFRRPEPLAELKDKLRGAFFPAVKFRGRRVFVVWQGKGENFIDHLYTVNSDDYGESWSGIDKITTGRSNNQAPAIEIIDDTVYLVYMNNSKKNWAITMLRGFNYGTRWDEPLTVSDTNANCYSPDIEILPDDKLIVTWHDGRDRNSNIFYRTYSLQQKKLLDEKKLSVTGKKARASAAMRTGNSLAVFWEEGGKIIVNHTDVYAMPPAVYSRTHREDRWTRRTDAVIEWRKPDDDSGIAGYATLVDNRPDTSPTIQNYRYDTRRVTLSGLEDGITYFHIRTIDGAGNMSRTVHYRLQVSSNPLAMPVIVSSSHPESKKSMLRDGVIRWAVNDSRRLKGFLYSFTRGEAVKPSKFLRDFELPLSGLENGVYFLNLASVSKTNQISRVATYSFIVGAEGKYDPEYMKKIANRKYRFKEGRQKKPALPGVIISLPFDESVPFDRDSFNAILRTVNTGSDVSGYSVVVSSTKKIPPERINLKGNILRIDDLKDGSWVIGARARYAASGKRKGAYLWTEPVYRKFSISVPVSRGPFGKFYQGVVLRIGENPLTTSLLALIITGAVIFFGFGNRIIFYFSHLRYRLRMMVNSMRF